MYLALYMVLYLNKYLVSEIYLWYLVLMLSTVHYLLTSVCLLLGYQWTHWRALVYKEQSRHASNTSIWPECQVILIWASTMYVESRVLWQNCSLSKVSHSYCVPHLLTYCPPVPQVVNIKHDWPAQGIKLHVNLNWRVLPRGFPLSPEMSQCNPSPSHARGRPPGTLQSWPVGHSGAGGGGMSRGP